MPLSQMKMGLAAFLLLVALLDRAKCSSSIVKEIPVKPGEVNQTFVVNVPPTVGVKRTEQRGNDTSARLIVPRQAAGGDCLLSGCDENDVGCDGLEMCGPYCQAEACPRVNCSRCWQTGLSGPCCWSCCSQYTYSQQRQQAQVFQYPQPEAIPVPQLRPLQIPQTQFIPVPQPQPIPIPQPQPIPIPQPQPIPIPQLQTFPIAQPQPIPVPQLQPYPIAQPQPIPIPQPQSIPIPQQQAIPIPQPQPFPIPQPQPIPMPQPQPIPFPQSRPVPFPISVPQPYPVPQPVPYPQSQPQLQQVLSPQPSTYYMPQQCRQIPSWPYLQCPQSQPTNCGSWYQPGCTPQPRWPNLCYTVGLC